MAGENCRGHRCGERGYIKPETVRCRLSREVLKAVHRMESLLNDRPHKLFRL